MEDRGLTDERLRELYDRALARDAAASPERARCVAPEEILALVRREGSDERRLEVLDHVMACDVCRGEFELLRSIERTGTEQAAVARPWARRGWRQSATVALAASLILVVGVGLWQRFGRPEGSDVVRGEPDAVTLVAPPPDVDVTAGAPLTFAWRPAPGARRYELEVLDDQGTVVFTVATSDTTAVLAEVRRLAPGAEYRWWVRARDDAGAQRTSPLRSLRTRRK